MKLGLLLFSTIVASESQEEVAAVRSHPFKVAMMLAQVVVAARKKGPSVELRNTSEPVILDKIRSCCSGMMNNEKVILDRYVSRHNVILLPAL